jgi:glycosyltransferase involved in cell wall biosynthesis
MKDEHAAGGDGAQPFNAGEPSARRRGDADVSPPPQNTQTVAPFSRREDPRQRQLVSIVMPVWRPRRDWLVEATASALTQEQCSIELIVVDDGCEPPVEQLLTEIEDERLRVVRIEHGGVSRARNAGLAVARGAYVRFLDCDDVLEPRSTARLLSLAAGAPDVIAYGATVGCDEELRPRSTISCTLAGDALADCLLGRFTVRFPSMLFPRAVVERVGEFDVGLQNCQDGDYVLRALEHAHVRGEDRIATYYRRHGRSATADIAAGERGLQQMITRYFERHPEQRGTRLERRARAYVVLASAAGWGSQGRHREYAKRLARAFMLDPAAAARELRGRVRSTARRRAA